ncbi:MAG: hypothetical protein WD749_02720 [Phycisphaerales bacterium]
MTKLRAIILSALSLLLVAAPAWAQATDPNLSRDPTGTPTSDRYSLYATFSSEKLVFAATYSEVYTTRRHPVQYLEIHLKSAQTNVKYEVAANGIPFGTIEVDSFGYGYLFMSASKAGRPSPLPFFAPGDVISVGPGKAKFIQW